MIRRRITRPPGTPGTDFDGSPFSRALVSLASMSGAEVGGRWRATHPAPLCDVKTN